MYKKIITNKKLSEAFTYVKNQHVELEQFLNDGKELDKHLTWPEKLPIEFKNTDS